MFDVLYFGGPDMEDIAGTVETLFEVCSGEAAKHSSLIAEMMAVKGLALAGVKKGIFTSCTTRYI